MQVRTEVRMPEFQARQMPGEALVLIPMYFPKVEREKEDIQDTSRAAQLKWPESLIQFCQHCGRFVNVCDKESFKNGKNRRQSEMVIRFCILPFGKVLHSKQMGHLERLLIVHVHVRPMST